MSKLRFKFYYSLHKIEIYWTFHANKRISFSKFWGWLRIFINFDMNINSTTKEKWPLGICSGEGEYITHYICSNGNNWIYTQLRHVIAAENLTACEGYESTRHAGANDIIFLPENVNRMMGLWIRNIPTVFRSPLLSDSVLDSFLANQEFSGPRVIR